MDCSSERQHVSQVTSWQTGLPAFYWHTNLTGIFLSSLIAFTLDLRPWTLNPGESGPWRAELHPRQPGRRTPSLHHGQSGHWTAWLQPWPWTAWSSGSLTSTIKTHHSKTGQCFHKNYPKTKTLRIWFSIFKRNTILQSQPYEFGYFNPVECFTLVDIFKRQCIV